ncbi:MAG: helix-turn-helix domain-containing protein [Chloroflexi bacterium]|nr:helix-turn-helix domain-containing protein [Chloroflexota bacterium]
MDNHETFSGRKLVINLDEPSGNVEQLLKGLASGPRIDILRYLGGHSSSVNEIADALSIPATTAALHINQLEKAGLIRTELKPASRGLQKICVRLYDQVVMTLPVGELPQENTIDIVMPIGAYVDCNVTPTCGLASEHGIIGNLDDPATFYDPGRLNAQLLWFKYGYVEYRFPNRLPANAILENLQISFEVCSEAPLHNDDWPSDITLWINEVEVGTWTSPGDFGGERGALTPNWWEEWNSQYGLLKVWRITDHGSYVDGTQISGSTLSELNIEAQKFMSVRVGVKEDAANIGGINIFGCRFGNYPQDILMRMRFRG